MTQRDWLNGGTKMQSSTFGSSMKSEPETTASTPDQPQRIYLPLHSKEGESRQQRNERVAAEMLLAIRLQEGERKAKENLRAAGFSEEEIEELGRIY